MYCTSTWTVLELFSPARASGEYIRNNIRSSFSSVFRSRLGPCKPPPSSRSPLDQPSSSSEFPVGRRWPEEEELPELPFGRMRITLPPKTAVHFFNYTNEPFLNQPNVTRIMIGKHTIKRWNWCCYARTDTTQRLHVLFDIMSRCHPMHHFTNVYEIYENISHWLTAEDI